MICPRCGNEMRNIGEWYASRSMYESKSRLPVSGTRKYREWECPSCRYNRVVVA